MVNSPLPSDLTSECRKAAKIIEHFIKPEKGKGPDQLIPPHIIANAKGIAVLTVIKAGFLFSGRAGSGLVIARLDNGGWSAPSAIGTAGMGVGGQIGAELTDFVIILNTRDAVKAFSHGGNVTLGGNLSVAAGPIGRNAEAAGTVGNFAAIFSYSKTRGLFAGVSIEGSVIVERKDANATFYHRKVSAKELLSGSIPPPPAAEELYRALNRRAGTTSTLPGNGTMPASYGSSGSIAQAPSTGIENSKPTAPAAWAAPPQGFLSNPAPGVAAPAQGFLSSPTPGVAAPPPPATKKGDTAVALYDFAGERSGDLGFKKGDIIVIVQKTQSQNDWWTGKCNGKEGAFPANYVALQ
ncbi:uncharacterized protein SPPG_03216 [Spizellomyces punctatus DAOM BR117]|uniref:SH3 domain-containing protein n=1 Tax=Spizellomyces punctatus (strain DAOM BR117) TaxID=645134 RepID=A0A0L0HIW8_SPIPD|nr:uncharacterized protein SPPG_03216 [Spizellomyces punctatus DAOM BR117]KND01406.1 hypothetical protein SPPG_03216 [Spizellomyces punctatus DAOM BR117]|eukprot:XP_016609445.1 hypothetical protein SPPG_03216 [Spizellomyces punctatus DAOM BR117]